MSIILDNQYEIDQYNQRSVCYIYDASKAILDYLVYLEENQHVRKTIIYTLLEHIETFNNYGFSMEGRISGFFQGKDAYILTKYKGSTRNESVSVDSNQQIMEIVRDDHKVVSKVRLDRKFEISLATGNDVDALSNLYQQVFTYYPTSVHDPDYLRTKINKDYFFVTIKENNTIVSAASAMIKPEYNSAEITDCATDPTYRGNNLLYSIILEIEKELLNRGVQTFFSLTRSQSPAMNLTVKRLGYKYEGTLINNCKIYSGFEDMNIWTKSPE
jgi:putative beta-lysine N-acetyltransferase